jgi:hypothetical protein
LLLFSFAYADFRQLPIFTAISLLPLCADAAPAMPAPLIEADSRQLRHCHMAASHS